MTKLNLLLEAKFDGTNWEDISEDVMKGVSSSYGMGGNDIKDRVANTGTLMFTLKNSESNSANLLGYYSPGNANCRTGFNVGLPVRIRFLFDGIYWVNWIGEIIPGGINVTTGVKKERTTEVVCNDWFYHATNHKLNEISYATNKRADEGITSILADMVAQPVSTSFDVGNYTFTSVFGDLRPGTPAIAALQRLVTSERGYLYLRDGVLVFENNTHRDTITNTTEVALPSALCGKILLESGDSLLLESGDSLLKEDTTPISFDNTMFASSKASSDLLYNRVINTAYPQTEFSGTLAATKTRIELPAGETKTGIVLGYVDPDSSAIKVSLKSYTTPSSGTDYTMNAERDGSGANITADLVATYYVYADKTLVDIENTGLIDGYVYLQLRGVGIRNFDPISKQLDDATSQSAYGIIEASVLMPYQNDPIIADAYASFDLSNYKDPHPMLKSVTFKTNDDEKRQLFLASKIGDRINIKETISGIDDDYFIYKIDWFQDGYNNTDGALINFTWYLKRAAADVFTS